MEPQSPVKNLMLTALGKIWSILWIWVLEEWTLPKALQLALTFGKSSNPSGGNLKNFHSRSAPLKVPKEKAT
jgi:hypothetical protein